MGIYLSVTLTCRYHASQPDQKIDSALLYPALKRVVLSQPMLHVGILDEHTNKASFCHVRHVDLSHHVSFSTLPCETMDQYDDHIALQQSRHHNQRFPDVASRPPWRIEVVEPSVPDHEYLSGMQDIIFSYHHAILDGISGRIFHEKLLVQLNTELHDKTVSTTLEPPSPTSTLLDMPQIIHLPAPQAQIPFQVSPSYFVKTLWNEFAPAMLRAEKPTPWHSKPIDLSLPYVTITKPVDVPGPALSKLIQACRHHKTTITAIFHALILASLTTRLSPAEASCFAAATPISLRPFLPAQSTTQLKEMLAVLVTGNIYDFTPPTVSHLRHASPESLTPTIWALAHQVKTDLSLRTSTLPKDDASGLLKYVTDWFDFFRKKDGKPRLESWVVSNIGVFKDDNQTRDTDNGTAPRFTVSRVYFTNGAMVTGPPLGLGIGSVVGGALTLALSWQEGVVSDELMGGLAEDLQKYMVCFDKTGSFC